MRKLYFLLPGTDGKFVCGGLSAELKTLNLAQQLCSTEIVTYRQREEGKLFLDDVLQNQNLDDVIFVISWGFDVAKLSRKLKFYNVVYHAHSAGYKFTLPASIPIITVSRNTMGYWGQKSPHALIYYLPNQISDDFHNLNLDRDIDVLVLARKSSEYLIQELIPALQSHCNVEVIKTFVDDIPKLFNRSKIYLYDSAEYWAIQGVSEGFGLQPLEAMACGCRVFSSINGGLSDYLDPGFNCDKIAGYGKEYDADRILKLLNSWTPYKVTEGLLAEYREENILQRMQIILEELNLFFDHKKSNLGNINDLTPMRINKLRLQRILDKLKQKVFQV